MENQLFYSNIDLNGNYISNLSVEVLSTSEINESIPQSGRIYFDSQRKTFVGYQGERLEDFNTSNTYSTIRINTENEGHTDLPARNQSDTFSIKQGFGVSLSVNEENNEVTINADLNYSSNNYSTIIGDDTNTSYTITHGLGSTAIIPQVVIVANANVSPTLTALQYEIVDDDTVIVELSEPPGVDTLRFNVTSKLGQRGETGPQGLTGFQGIRGYQGFQGIDGTEALIFTANDSGKVLFSNSSGYPTVSNVLQIVNTNSSNAVVIETSNAASAVMISHSIANVTGNVMHVVASSTTTPNSGNINAIIVETDIADNVEEIFSVDLLGNVRAKSLANSSMSFNYLASIKPDGSLDKTDISTERINVLLKKTVTISSSAILNSYNIPVLLIEAKGGYSINLISVFGKYNYNSVSYDWPEPGVIAISGQPTPLVTINNALLNGSESGYFNYTVNAYDSSGAPAFMQHLPLIFRTLTANPTNGNGTITLELTYKYVEF